MTKDVEKAYREYIEAAQAARATRRILYVGGDGGPPNRNLTVTVHDVSNGRSSRLVVDESLLPMLQDAFDRRAYRKFSSLQELIRKTGESD